MRGAEEAAPTAGATALRAVVRGRVQGVGFRDFVWRQAAFLGLVGYVRNGDDGRSLEVVAEGEREKLEQLLDCLREGPRGARVEDVDVRWGAASGRFTAFGIAY